LELFGLLGIIKIIYLTKLLEISKQFSSTKIARFTIVKSLLLQNVLIKLRLLLDSLIKNAKEYRNI